MMCLLRRGTKANHLSGSLIGKKRATCPSPGAASHGVAATVDLVKVTGRVSAAPRATGEPLGKLPDLPIYRLGR